MFSILPEIQYLCKVRYGFIEPMHRNKPNITYLLQTIHQVGLMDIGVLLGSVLLPVITAC